MIEIFDNIRMIYDFRQPSPALAPYVEFFSESCGEATSALAMGNTFSVKMFPSYAPTFWINLGPSYHLSLGNKQYFIPSGEGVVVTRDGIAERYNQPNDHLFTVKFYPGGLEHLLGIDQTKMAGRLVALKDIIPVRILARLKDANDLQERIQVFESFLLSQLPPAAARTRYLELIQNTIATYTDGNMQYNVDELSARLFVTSKTISRYFNNVIGTTPKQYLSTIRSRTALAAYVADKRHFEPTRYGYYDMSHFYREIIKFTGESMRRTQE